MKGNELGYDNGRRTTPLQREVLARDNGYDDGGRYALLAVSGFAMSYPDKFGTVLSIIDCCTGEEIEQSVALSPSELSDERRHMIARVRHLNGKQDEFAA